MLRPFITTVALAAMLTTHAASAEPTEGVALTVYNNNFAVVKDTRTLELAGKLSTLGFTDVAKRIDATSVHFKSLTDPAGTKVIEQNFEFDLVSANKMLEKYIDTEIQVFGEDAVYKGKLLSFDNQQLVLDRGDDGITMIQRPDNITNINFSQLPEGLLTRPTLVWQLATDKPGDHLAQVTYQTSGLSWKADYNVVVNADDTAMDLSGWVTINNRSGATYEDAKIKLIAGDVRKVQSVPDPQRRVYKAGSAVMADAAPRGFEQKSFFEYHLYTLGRPSTVKDNQVKQIELLTAAEVPVLKRYVFEPGGRFWHRRYGDKDEYKVNVFVEFTNDKKSNLGMPLPKGTVRVYKRDAADGDLEFIGEDQIDHTPRDEELRLYLGDAFDLVGEKKVAKQEQGKRWRTQDIEIKLRNHKEGEAVTIRVREHLGHGNWEIKNPSHEFKQVDAKTVEFDIPVKAGEEAVLAYNVHYTW